MRIASVFQTCREDGAMSPTIPMTRAVRERPEYARSVVCSACEILEPRRLLAGEAPNAALWHRLATGTATAADLEEHDLAVVNVLGTETYAKAGEWIVKFHLNGNRPTAADAVAQLGLGARLKRTLGETDLALIELPRQIVYEQLQARLNRLRLGAYVERNMVVVPTTDERFPFDEAFGEQWSLHNTGQTMGTPDADIDAPAAWNITTGGSAVVMAVFGDGIDYTHPDSQQRHASIPGFSCVV